MGGLVLFQAYTRHCLALFFPEKIAVAATTDCTIYSWKKVLHCSLILSIFRGPLWAYGAANVHALCLPWAQTVSGRAESLSCTLTMFTWINMKRKIPYSGSCWGTLLQIKEQHGICLRVVKHALQTFSYKTMVYVSRIQLMQWSGSSIRVLWSTSLSSKIGERVAATNYFFPAWL